MKVFVGLGEELVDLLVEVVDVFAQGAVARVRYNPEVSVRNVLVDEDGVGNGNEVVVAANDERRGLDGVELGESDVRLLPVEEEELAVVFFPWRWRRSCAGRNRIPSFRCPRVRTGRHQL